MTATLVPRKKSTPRNPFGVVRGQIWARRVHPYATTSSDLIVVKVDLHNGVAHCKSTKTFKHFGGKPRRTIVQLRRFSPRYGYYLQGEAQ